MLQTNPHQVNQDQIYDYNMNIEGNNLICYSVIAEFRNSKDLSIRLLNVIIMTAITKYQHRIYYHAREQFEWACSNFRLRRLIQKYIGKINNDTIP